MTEPLSDDKLAEIRAGTGNEADCMAHMLEMMAQVAYGAAQVRQGDTLSNAARIVRSLLARLDKAEEALRQIVDYEADLDGHNRVASYFATLASKALPTPPKEDRSNG